MQHFPLGTQNLGQGPGEGQTGNGKKRAQEKGQAQRLGESAVAALFVPLSPADGIADAAAHAQHQPQTVDQAVNRQSQVEGGQSLGSHGPGNKEGVRQDITGDSQHSQHIQAGIPGKLPLCTVFVHRFPSIACKKRTPELSIFNGLRWKAWRP